MNRTEYSFLEYELRTYLPSVGVPVFLFIVAFLVDRYLLKGPGDAIKKYGKSVFLPEPASCCAGCCCPTCVLSSSIASAGGNGSCLTCLPLCCCLSWCPIIGHAWATIKQERINASWGGRNMCLRRFFCVLFCMPCAAAQMSRAVAAHAVAGSGTTTFSSKTKQDQDHSIVVIQRDLEKGETVQ